MMASQVVQKLEEEGFKVKISDCGIIAHLHHRTPSRAEIVDAVPELKKCPMGRVEEGVLVEFEDSRFLP